MAQLLKQIRSDIAATDKLSVAATILIATTALVVFIAITLVNTWCIIKGRRFHLEQAGITIMANVFVIGCICKAFSYVRGIKGKASLKDVDWKNLNN